MAKRNAEDSGVSLTPLKKGERPEVPENGHDENAGEDYEDEFEDEFESEDEIFEAGVDGRPDVEREAEEEQQESMDLDNQTFIPGRHQLEKGQTLAPDPTAYELLHSLSTAWPCLSFDILPDNLGDSRKSYPATLYAVAGTQAEGQRAGENEVLVMKLSSLSRMDRLAEDSDSDDDESDDENADPILESKSIPLQSTTNRIRSHMCGKYDGLKPPTTFTAAMTEDAQIQIHNITSHLTSFDRPGTIITPQNNKPVYTIKQHRSEGYALDWSPLVTEGKLLTGDNDGRIFVTSCTDGGKWTTESKPFTGHTSSVEDIQWSPNERNVFSSASSDGTVKVWDLRAKAHKPAVSVKISDTDVNVISWSKQTAHLLASGADDGQWAVWDLRQWKPSTTTSTPNSVAAFNFHKEQITSIEWHPTEDSIVGVAAGDNTLTLWDLAVELDDEESKYTADVSDVPPQLLFVHYMEQVKECHWHPQIPGCMMATGGAGFGVFKTISV